MEPSMKQTERLIARVLACLPRRAWQAALAAGSVAGMPATGWADAADIPEAAIQAEAPAEAPAGAGAPTEPWAEGDTVRDLLRADAQAARAARPLQRAADWLGRAPQAEVSATPGHLPDAADRIDVMAIYGVGKALHADISVNGRLARYRAGRERPVAGGHPGAGDPYALVAIDGPCVRLRKAGQPHTACLSLADGAHD